MTLFLQACLAVVAPTIAIALLSKKRYASDTIKSRPGVTHWIMILSWSYSVLPGLLEYWLRGRHQKTLALSVLSGPVGISARLALLLSVAIAIACLIALLGGLRAKTSTSVATLIFFMLPWVTINVLSALHSGDSPTRQLVLYPLVALAFWVKSPPLIDMLRLFGSLTIATAAISLMLAVAKPQAAAYFYSPSDGTTGKAIFEGGFLLAGVYTHPNQLGVVLALGVPAVLLLRSRFASMVGLAVVFTALTWAGSRTSLFAAAVSLLLVVFVNRKPARYKLLTLATVTSVALTVVTPLVVSSSTAFAERGQIWLGSLKRLSNMLWLGGGPNFYRAQLEYATDLGAYGGHGHNVLVNTLTIGGLVGLAALCVLLIILFRSAKRYVQQSVMPMVYVVTLLLTSWLEVPFDFSSLGVFGYAVWLPMATMVFAGKQQWVNERADRISSAASLNQAVSYPRSNTPFASVVRSSTSPSLS